MNARSTLRGLRHAPSLAVAVLLVGINLPATVFAQPENIPRFIGEQVIASWRAYPPTAEGYRYELTNAMVRDDNYEFVRQIQAQQADRGRQPLSESLHMLVENRVISALDTIYFRTLSNAQNADQARAAAQHMRASESLTMALLGATVIHLIEQTEAEMYANTAADAADGISWGELAGAAAAGAGIGANIGGAVGGSIGAAVAVAVAIYGQLFGDRGDDDGGDGRRRRRWRRRRRRRKRWWRRRPVLTGSGDPHEGLLDGAALRRVFQTMAEPSPSAADRLDGYGILQRCHVPEVKA